MTAHPSPIDFSNNTEEITLHRYLDVEGAYKTLEHQQLKVSKLTTFNDPFEFAYRGSESISPERAQEFMFRMLENPEFDNRKNVPHGFRNTDDFKTLISNNNLNWLTDNYQDLMAKLLPSFKHSADKHIRVCCFSGLEVPPTDEILLWSHYAANHTGVRLRYTFEANNPQKCIHPVFYTENRVEFDLLCRYDPKAMLDSIETAACTKSIAWRYENEHRLIVRPSDCVSREIDGNDASFIEFGKSQIVSVDFGIRCNEEQKIRIC